MNATVTITLADIAAAQNNDLEATALILEATESRVMTLANRAAYRMNVTGDALDNYRDEYAQVARIAVWEALPRFDADTVDAFFGFMYATIEGKLLDAVRHDRNGGAGADKDAIKAFASVLEAAEGDVYKAEKLVQELPKGKRLSADRANAARLSWQGSVSIDKGSDDSEAGSILYTLASDDETPEVARPKVGTGAALEALSVLQMYSTARDVLSAVPLNSAQVDAIEDTVRVPRDAAERRYVLDAVAILRSYVSTVAEGELSDDLRDVSDDRREERDGKNSAVREVLDDMGKRGPMQRDAITLAFGIGDSLRFGRGDDGDLNGMAAYMGVSYSQAQLALTKGLKAFAKRWIARVASTEAEALSLADAVTVNLGRGGRK
jgi:DNA-directed RNA polymerase specialized sigma subunit